MNTLMLNSAVLLAALFITIRICLKVFKHLPAAGFALNDPKNTPTVSVCIAARNEKHAMAQCLEYVLSSAYPKLEILVLDDSSSDETSVIIKSFAHEGVRFIPGRELPEGWLGRNHAYQTLANEASGEYILYLDVDTLLSPMAIGNIMSIVTKGQLDMVSVQPRRDDIRHPSATFGSLRAIWELLFGTRNQPSCSSALWLVRREALMERDEPFERYGLSVRPEEHLASIFGRKQTYAFVLASKSIGVRFEKKLLSQLHTAERLYVPLFGKSIIGAFRALLVYASAILTVVLLLAAPVYGLQWWMSAAAILVFLTGFAVVTYATSATSIASFRMLLSPYLLLQDLLFYVYSLVRYMSKTVSWKGRLVQAPPIHSRHITLDE